MNYEQISQELVDFIAKCPSMFHTVSAIRHHLDQAGFTYLPEQNAWCVQPGGSYYTVRNNSSIVAFKVGAQLPQDGCHFQMTAVHGDSPTYKLKAQPELEGPAEYLRLNVEGYGGGIDASWLDKPLGLAGRVMVQDDSCIQSRLLFIDQDVLLIPNVAIHMNRQANDGFSFNKQIDLCPLFSAGQLKQGDFLRMIAGQLDVQPKQILSHDLYLVNRQQGCIWGWAKEFVSSPRLDDLQCAFASLKAFLASGNQETISVFACFDNEEVGSGTKQGALSTFLADTLQRINERLGRTAEDYHRALACSFMVSCDNAHAVHPNHPEKTDAQNNCQLNGGVVIKESANQRYTTDAFSRALFKAVCQRANVPVQVFANRSDTPGGSTLGNLSNTQVSVHALDIGLPQLAMHSSYETAGVKDTGYAIQALTEFFNTTLRINGADNATL